MRAAQLVLSLAGALAFPSLPEEPRLAIVTPAHGSSIDPKARATVDVNVTLTSPLSLLRLCLTLQHEGTPYADGCFARGQPISLRKLISGQYTLSVAGYAAHGGEERASAYSVFWVESPAASASTPPSVFTPSYEWRSVGEGEAVPAGLSVKLALRGAGEQRSRLARLNGE